MEPAAHPPAFPGAGTSAATIRIAQPEAAWFASDMHLDDSQPGVARRFLDLLEAALASTSTGTEPSCLFLLGDIFEYWIGDDHLPEVARSLAARLSAFSRSGGRVFLMHGNRDFLLDVPLPSQPNASRFSVRCGATLLPDPSVIDVAGRRVALSHGDALCTDDERYQQWRLLCRSAAWQQQFLGRPVAERLALAQSLRQQSIQAQAVTETVSDVNQVAVDLLMTKLDSNLLIHGHTHQPMLHRWCSGASPGTAAAVRRGERRLRWVLSDWAAEPPRGGIQPLTEAAQAA